MPQRTQAAALLVLLVGFVALGAKCTPSPKPIVSATLDAIADDLNDLLVVPTDTPIYVNAVFTQNGSPIAPATTAVTVHAWSGVPGPVSGTVLAADSDGALAVVPALSLVPGTYRVVVLVEDVNGNAGSGFLDFAVRERTGAAPIGTGQQIWYDFTSDRDGVPGPDFPVDLEVFGLGSPVAPVLSDQVEADVIAALLARVAEVYDQDPVGLGSDPVDLQLLSSDPGSGDVTRICVGGPDPSGGNVIGKIALDPQNGNRGGVECGSLPPTGIFPREMTFYQGQAPFQQSFSPVMPSLGGTPVGEHALDAIVLDPAFDPGTATSEELARYTDVTTAIQRFANSLGSIIAHETGHALGLVAPGPPGVGLFGGQLGAEFTHNVTSDLVTTPATNYVMNRGGSFNFAKLAGIYGYPLPFFRALNYAYLRDRVMLDSKVTQLLPPPVITDVSPTTISGTVELQVTGDGFVEPAEIRLVDPPASYQALGEVVVSGTLVTGLVFSIQIPPGSYFVEVENPDGQTALSPATVTVQ